MSNSTDPQGDNTDSIHVNDREIDALMAEYGLTWDEADYYYSNEDGEKRVSGDFASEMTKRLKAAQQDRERVQIEARIDEQGNTVADAEGSIYYSAGDAITDDVRQHSRLEHLKAQLSQSIEKEETE